MDLGMKQSQRLGQSLVMTPQLQQAIKLLQLNRLELVEAIQTELNENPVLEEAGEQAVEEKNNDIASPEHEVPMEASKVDQDAQTVTGDEKKAIEDFDWESYFESNRFALPPSAGGSGNTGEEMPSLESTMTKKGSLQDHLIWQLSCSELSEEEREIAAALIGELDDSGYLPADAIQAVIEERRATQVDVECVLSTIQDMDPIGVGARDLRECLTLQAIHIGHTDDLVMRIIKEHLPQVEKHNLAAIARLEKLPLEQVITAVKIIETMEPRPGRLYSDQEAQYITPDIYVYKMGEDFTIVLNEDGLPRLKISRYYKDAVSAQGGAAKAYIQDKLRNAVWLIRSIHQRQRTIYKVVESILKFQRPFFESGVSHLRPLILRQVADDIGMHESTVSRVTSNKYVHTPQGIFELKYFFNSSVSSTDGDDIASEAVKDLIKKMVAVEDAKHPLSDQTLAEMIKEKHQIEIARRTVAKYREMMGILSSAKRRKLY